MNDATRDLCEAARFGDVPGLEGALFGGASIDAPDDDNGNTALLIAAAHMQSGAFRFLIERGADVNVKNVHGFNASAMILVNANDRSPSLVRDMLTLAMQSGTDPCFRDHRQRTLLHLAAIEGCDDDMSLLLACGIDPHAIDEQGCTALHLATQRNMATTPRYLALAMASPLDAVNHESKTALQIALDRNYATAVTCLLALGASRETVQLPPGSPNQSLLRQSVLECAVESMNPTLVQASLSRLQQRGEIRMEDLSKALVLAREWAASGVHDLLLSWQARCAASLAAGQAADPAGRP